MRYAILIYDTETANPSPEPPPAEVMQQVMDEYFAYSKMLRDRGAWQAGEALLPVQTATTIRGSESGDVTATDGPFAETTGLIAGWMGIDVDSYERALELAGELSAAPGAGGKPIHEWLEVRPFLAERPTVTE